MRRSLAIFHDTYGLKKPFRISRGEKTAVEAITVELSFDGFVGRGEGIPYSRYGESIASSIAQIEAAREEIEGGIGRVALLDLMPAGAARNAVDCALWDLTSRQTSTPVHTILGIDYPSSVATAITIGLDTVDAMAAAAARHATAKTLKIKVDDRDPIARIRAIRAVAPASRVIVDPNESWSFADLVSWMPQLLELGVDLIEQPLPAGGDDQLAGLSPTIRIAADESIHDIATLDGIAGRYQVINIKLDKTGGLTAALMLADAGRQRGLGIMLGCMVCSSLSIAPAVHLLTGAEFVDLDGPIDLMTDQAGRIDINSEGVFAFDGQDRLWGGL